MPLTLKRIKEFLSDNMIQAGDGSAVRNQIRVLQEALLRLSRVHEWDYYRERARLTLDSAIESDLNATPTPIAVSATTGSRVFTFTTPILEQRFVTDEWDLFLEDDSLLIYQFEEITSPTRGLAKPGQLWVEADVVDGGFRLYHTRYRLPKPFKQIRQVALLREDILLKPMTITDYEAYRRHYMTSVGQPWVYTARNQAIEVWPPPVEELNYHVEIDYDRRVELPEIDTADDSIVDWPEEMEDLLRVALRVSLVELLGAEKVRFDPGAATNTYMERLRGYQDETQGRAKVLNQLRMGGRKLRSIRDADPIYPHALRGRTDP